MQEMRIENFIPWESLLGITRQSFVMPNDNP